MNALDSWKRVSVLIDERKRSRQIIHRTFAHISKEISSFSWTRSIDKVGRLSFHAGPKKEITLATFSTITNACCYALLIRAENGQVQREHPEWSPQLYCRNVFIFWWAPTKNVPFRYRSAFLTLLLFIQAIGWLTMCVWERESSLIVC